MWLKYKFILRTLFLFIILFISSISYAQATNKFSINTENATASYVTILNGATIATITYNDSNKTITLSPLTSLSFPASVGSSGIQLIREWIYQIERNFSVNFGGNRSKEYELEIKAHALTIEYKFESGCFNQSVTFTRATNMLDLGARVACTIPFQDYSEALFQFEQFIRLTQGSR